MNDNEVGVRIVGDASGVAPAVQQAKSDIVSLSTVVNEAAAGFREGFGAQLRANLAQASAGVQQTKAQVIDLNGVIEAATAGFREGFEKGAMATQHMTQEVKQLHSATEQENLSLREMGHRVNEGVESFNKFRSSLASLVEIYAAFFMVEQIKEWAEKLGDAAEKLEHLSQTLGMATTQIQGLQAAAAATDLPFETLQKGLGLLDKKLETDPKTFAKLGIDIKAGADNMEVLLAVADRFKGMENGPNKVAMAMELMGRNGAAMIPFLNMGADGIAELTKKAEEYGAVNAEATKVGNQLAESVDEQKIAFMGLQQTLTQAFAPLLTEITDGFNGLVKSMTTSYESGGIVKIVFDGIVTLFEGFGEIINALGSAFTEAFSGMGVSTIEWADVIKGMIEGVVVIIKGLIWTVVALADGTKIAFDAIIGASLELWAKITEVFGYIGLGVDVLQKIFATFGQIVGDALTLNWGAIAGDWAAGMDQLDGIVRSKGAQIVNDAKAIHDQAAGWFADAQSKGKGFAAWSGGFWQSDHKPAATGVKQPDAGKLDEGPDLSKTAKEKKPKDDLVQQLDAVLTAKKLAWAMEQDAQGTAQQYSLQSEADYWKEVLTRTDLSTKNRASIEEKYLAVHSQLVRERIAIVIDGYKQELAEADKNAEAKLAVANRELAYIGRTFGLESKEYAAAQAQIVKIKREAEQQKQALEELTKSANDAAALDEITEAQAVAQHRVAMGVETNAQLLEQERTFENQKYQIQLAAAQRARALVDPQKDPQRAAQLNARLEQLERQHQAKLSDIDRQATAQRTAMARQAITATGNLWGQNIAKLITLQQGFATMVKALYLGMVDIISNALASVIQKWIEQQLAAFLFKRTAQSVDGLASVTSNAAIAGSAAFASIAAIPVVGPGLAPAAAAAAFAGAMSFAPLASAEGGDWNVRAGLYNLHPEEMVLPAWAAKPLRSIIGGAANSNAPLAANEGGKSGGDTHNYYIKAMDGLSVKRVLMDNAKHVAAAGRAGVRQGAVTGK